MFRLEGRVESITGAVVGYGGDSDRVGAATTGDLEGVLSTVAGGRLVAVSGTALPVLAPDASGKELVAGAEDTPTGRDRIDVQLAISFDAVAAAFSSPPGSAPSAQDRSAAASAVGVSEGDALRLAVPVVWSNGTTTLLVAPALPDALAARMLAIDASPSFMGLAGDLEIVSTPSGNDARNTWPHPQAVTVRAPSAIRYPAGPGAVSIMDASKDVVSGAGGESLHLTIEESLETASSSLVAEPFVYSWLEAAHSTCACMGSDFWESQYAGDYGPVPPSICGAGVFGGSHVSGAGFGGRASWVDPAASPCLGIVGGGGPGTRQCEAAADRFGARALLNRHRAARSDLQDAIAARDQAASANQDHVLVRGIDSAALGCSSYRAEFEMSSMLVTTMLGPLQLSTTGMQQAFGTEESGIGADDEAVADGTAVPALGMTTSSGSIVVGGAACRIISSNTTVVTCVVPPHPEPAAEVLPVSLYLPGVGVVPRRQ